MDDRFPVGLLLAACMFGAMGFSLLFPPKNGESAKANTTLSRTQLVAAVGLLAFSALLLVSVFNRGILFLVGPILLVVFGMSLAAAKLFDRGSAGKRE